MASTGAGDVYRGVFEGSITGSHMEVDRRPYHKNCSCALHGSKASKCSQHKTSKVSYPMRRSWSEGSLALYAAAGGSTSFASPSPSSSPAADLGSKIPPLPPPHNRRRQLDICNDDIDDLFPCKL